MTVTPDPFNFTAGETADAEQVDARFLPLYTALAGALDVDNLLPSLADKLGVSAVGSPRRGKSIIATEETRANAAFGLMPTPDRVSGIVLPTDGLIFVAYQALWKSSGGSYAGGAALFLGANQLKSRQAAAAPVAAGVAGGNVADRYGALFTTADRGLVAQEGAAAATSDVTTGQLVGGFANPGTFEWGGGPAVIFAAAGTYDVSVQFLASGGSVTAKERKLWVWTMAF